MKIYIVFYINLYSPLIVVLLCTLCTQTVHYTYCILKSIFLFNASFFSLHFLILIFTVYSISEQFFYLVLARDGVGSSFLIISGKTKSNTFLIFKNTNLYSCGWDSRYVYYTLYNIQCMLLYNTVGSFTHMKFTLWTHTSHDYESKKVF